MKSPVRPELPTASVGSSQAPTAAVDNSAPLATRTESSTCKSGNAVQTGGATSESRNQGRNEQKERSREQEVANLPLTARAEGEDDD